MRATTVVCQASLQTFQGLRATAPIQRRAFQPAHSSRTQPQRFCVTARAYEAGIGLFGTKAGMTSYCTEDGLVLPVTVIGFEEGNIVTQIKTEETDGYNAVQVGYHVVREDRLTKPERKHCEKYGAPPLRHLQEFKLKQKDVVEQYQPGQQLKLEELFKEGDVVDIAGKSIGKGFQGAIKRHHHKRGMMTHGSKSKRQHGSIGACATPSRVYPGLPMAGQMGNKRIKVKALKIVKVDLELNALIVKGAVPGKAGNLLTITPAKKVGINI